MPTPTKPMIGDYAELVLKGDFKLDEIQILKYLIEKEVKNDRKKQQSIRRKRIKA
jgi:hypothetical protein